MITVVSRDEVPRPVTRMDHLEMETEGQLTPAQARKDDSNLRIFRRDNLLRFHPHMTLLAAARIANEHNMKLECEWTKENGLQVVAVKR